MNPDPWAVSAYNAGREFAARELAEKRARSRAAQPRRKDNKKPPRSR